MRAFTFLAEIVSESNTLYITEGQEYISMAYLLKETSKYQFSEAKNFTADDDGSVTSWKEAVE